MGHIPVPAIAQCLIVDIPAYFHVLISSHDQRVSSGRAIRILKIDIIISGKTFCSRMDRWRMDVGNVCYLSTIFEPYQPAQIIHEFIVAGVTGQAGNNLISLQVCSIYLIDHRHTAAVQNIQILIILKAVPHELKANGRNKTMHIAAINNCTVCLRRRVQHEQITVMIIIEWISPWILAPVIQRIIGKPPDSKFPEKPSGKFAFNTRVIQGNGVKIRWPCAMKKINP